MPSPLKLGSTEVPFHLPEPLTITIDLPFPPSTNAIWRRSARGMILSKDYKSWIVACDRHLIMARSFPRGVMIHGPCEVAIALNLDHRRVTADLDNRLKALLDYAQRIEILQNDNLIMKLTAEWVRASAAPAGCRLTLTELAG